MSLLIIHGWAPSVWPTVRDGVACCLAARTDADSPGTADAVFVPNSLRSVQNLYDPVTTMSTRCCGRAARWRGKTDPWCLGLRYGLSGRVPAFTSMTWADFPGFTAIRVVAGGGGSDLCQASPRLVLWLVDKFAPAGDNDAVCGAAPKLAEEQVQAHDPSASAMTAAWTWAPALAGIGRSPCAGRARGQGGWVTRRRELQEDAPLRSCRGRVALSIRACAACCGATCTTL